MRRRRATRSIGGWSRESVVVLALQMLVLGLVAGPIAAGAQEEGMARVSVSRANFRAGASMDAEVIATLTEGEEVVVLAQEGSWYRVRHEESGIDGYLHETVIQVLPAPEPVAPPEPQVDEAEQARLEAERQRAERDRQEADRRAHEAALAREAQRARQGERRIGGERRVTGFLSFDAGLAWAASDKEEWRLLIDPNAGGGVTDDRITYHAPRGEAFSVGGGILFRSGFGVGIRVSQQQHEDPADIDLFSSFLVPPFQVDASARTAPQLKRRERAAHVSFAYAPLKQEQFQLQLFIGPTIFDVTQETVDDVFVTEVPFEIVGFLQGEQDDTAVGFHVGADVAWYWGGFGVGLSAYFSRGEVEFRDRSAEQSVGIDFAPQKVDVGGTQLMGGFRIRL